LRIGHALHRFIDAIEIHTHAAFHRGFGHVETMAESRLVRLAGDEHPEFFPAQFHARTVRGAMPGCQRSEGHEDRNRISREERKTLATDETQMEHRCE
jgi:hypothetical protein